MPKKLSEMTLEELWQLFPIFLTDPNPNWKAWFREEKEHLLNCLSVPSVIAHIGSTAINNIKAKPIVDILLEIPRETDMHALIPAIRQAGYILMSESENRLSFNKGYTEEGFAEKVFHLHVRHSGDNAEIAFRDHMNKHPEKAKAYERLKMDLWKKHEFDRDRYTMEKTDFVLTHTKEALKER